MEAESQEELNNELLNIDASIPHLKEKRREYLSTLRDVLDIYLLSVMEEEDPIFSLLSQRSQLHYNLKTISPFILQFKILLNLPFLESDIQVENGESGFVMLKLASVEEGMMRSKVWADACHRGIQKSLLRHVNQWKDDLNYLKQTAVLGWLACTVDKSLTLVGTIPNYKIQRQDMREKVVLQLEDTTKNMKFEIELLPVFALPSTKLPQQIAEMPIMSQSLSKPCDKWSVECRSSGTFNDRLWGISLWQHEKLMIKEHNNLKSVIHILKTLRDGCEWKLLTNYHIRTLVLQAYVRDPMMFEIFSLPELVSQLLLLLRDKLVSRDGLPFLWDSNYNLLCGLTGLQKSALARAVTKTRDKLLKLTDDYRSSFRLEIYETSPVSRTSEEDNLLSQPSTSTFQAFEAPPPSNTINGNVSVPEAGQQPQRTPSSREPTQGWTSREPLQRRTSREPSQNSPSREPPQRRTSPFGNQPERVSPAGQGGLGQVNQNRNWWQNVATVAAGAGAVVVTAVTAYALMAGKNRNQNK